MYCTKCGIQLEDQDKYCHECGSATQNARQMQQPLRLVRTILTDKKVAGVCGGFARYLNMDPTLVRVLWVLLTFGLPPAGLLGYIAAWIIIPSEAQILQPTQTQAHNAYPA